MSVNNVVIRIRDLEVDTAHAVVLDEELEIVKAQDYVEAFLPSMIKQDEIVVLNLNES